MAAEVVSIQQRIDEAAFAMLDMSSERREALFRQAWEQAIARHPEVTDIPPSVVVYVAAVYQRIAELERMPKGTA